MKKKALLVLFLLVSLLVFSACGTSQTADDPAQQEPAQQQQDSKKFKVGVASQTLAIEVYQLMNEAATKWLAENAPEVDFTWLACDYDPSKQISQVETFISQGYDCIVIEPVMPETGDTLIEMCQQAGIPVIDLETLAATAKAEVLIVADSYKVGKTQAQYFIDKYGTEEKAKTVVLSGTRGDYVAEEITKGLLDTLAEYNNIEIVMHQWCKDWDPTTAMGHMENALSAHKNDIDVVFANNDQMVNAALKAAINAGVAEDIWFIGSDFDRETVDNIRAGYRLAVLDKSPILQGERIAEASHIILTGGEIPYDVILDNGMKAWWTPITMVDSTNLEGMVASKYPDMAQ
jgi:D-xylose transport system substrate-binding protein